MPKTNPLTLLALSLAILAGPAALAQEYGSRGNLEKNATPAEREAMEALYERFVPYIDRARTELTMVRHTIEYAEARGFRAWDPALRGGESGGPLLRGEPGPHHAAVGRGERTARVRDAAREQPH